MATILVGYDTETAAIGEVLARMADSPGYPLYRLGLEPETCRRALALLSRIHGDLGVPCTLFTCGRTLLQALDALQAADASDLIDVQQHTYSHIPFRDVEYSPAPGKVARLAAPSLTVLREEVTYTSELIARYLGHRCVGIRTPFGYYRGLRDQPDLLAMLHDAGIRYVSSWGRSERNDNPTPWVQPFVYAAEGQPDLLELPFQFWLDVVWFDTYGYDTGPAYLEALKGAVDEIVEQDLVFGACFHDWVLIAADEARTGWLRGFLAYALERGVEVMTYTEFWRRRSAGA